MSEANIREGDLCKIIEIGGRRFEIRYGYYDAELERPYNAPMPIYPDFLKDPMYTTDGYAFVTGDQDICNHFNPKPRISDEGWCNDCTLFEKHEEFIGICKCQKRRIKPTSENNTQTGGTAI